MRNEKGRQETAQEIEVNPKNKKLLSRCDLLSDFTKIKKANRSFFILLYKLHTKSIFRIDKKSSRINLEPYFFIVCISN